MQAWWRWMLLLPGALATACSPANSALAPVGAGIPRLPSGAGAAELDPLVAARLESALTDCERGQPGALLELAKTYDANGLGELAVRTYELCLELRGAELGAAPARVPYLLACGLERCGRSEEALRVFEEVQHAVPDYAPTFWRAGNLWIEQGRGQEARRAFERALALEPEGVPHTIGLARVQLFEGEPGAALATLEPLARQRPRERFVHGLLARARRALGDEAGAREALQAEERAVETHWSDPWSAEVQQRASSVAAALEKANQHLLAGDARAALTVLEPVLERCPDVLALLLLVIKARIEAGALEPAAELITRARARHPGQFKLDFYAGLVALEKKDFQRAKRELESALALNPAFGPILAALGEVEFRLGELALAESAFERALEQGENGLRTRILSAQVLIQLAKPERACRLLEAARADFPGSVVPLAHLAEAHVRGGDARAARAALDEAVRIDPAFPYLGKVRELVAELEARSR